MGAEQTKLQKIADDLHQCRKGRRFEWKDLITQILAMLPEDQPFEYSNKLLLPDCCWLIENEANKDDLLPLFRAFMRLMMAKDLYAMVPQKTDRLAPMFRVMRVPALSVVVVQTFRCIIEQSFDSTQTPASLKLEVTNKQFFEEVKGFDQVLRLLPESLGNSQLLQAVLELFVSAYVTHQATTDYDLVAKLTEMLTTQFGVLLQLTRENFPAQIRILARTLLKHLFLEKDVVSVPRFQDDARSSGALLWQLDNALADVGDVEESLLRDTARDLLSVLAFNNPGSHAALRGLFPDPFLHAMSSTQPPPQQPARPADHRAAQAVREEGDHDDDESVDPYEGEPHAAPSAAPSASAATMPSTTATSTTAASSTTATSGIRAPPAPPPPRSASFACPAAPALPPTALLFPFFPPPDYPAAAACVYFRPAGLAPHAPPKARALTLSKSQQRAQRSTFGAQIGDYITRASGASEASQPRLPWNWSALFADYDRDWHVPHLIWNASTRDELRRSVRAEIKEFDQHRGAGPLAAWDYRGFAATYPSLESELQVGPFYLSLLIDAWHKASLHETPHYPITQPQLFLRDLYDALVIHDDLKVKLRVLHVLSQLAQLHPQQTHPILPLPYLVYLLGKPFSQPTTPETAELFADELQIHAEILAMLKNVFAQSPELMARFVGMSGEDLVLRHLQRAPLLAAWDRRSLDLRGLDEIPPPPPRSQPPPPPPNTPPPQGSDPAAGSSQRVLSYPDTEKHPIPTWSALSLSLCCVQMLHLLTKAPRLTRKMAAPSFWPYVLQATLCPDRPVVAAAADLVARLVDQHPKLAATLRTSGIFLFLLFDTRVSCPVEYASFFARFHRLAPEADAGDATPAPQGEGEARTSVLDSYLPPAVVRLLDQPRGAEVFASVLSGEVYKPDLIWDAGLRATLHDALVEELRPFTEAREAEAETIFRLPERTEPVRFPALEEEFYLGGVYVRMYARSLQPREEEHVGVLVHQPQLAQQHRRSLYGPGAQAFMLPDPAAFVGELRARLQAPDCDPADAVTLMRALRVASIRHADIAAIKRHEAFPALLAHLDLDPTEEANHERILASTLLMHSLCAVSVPNIEALVSAGAIGALEALLISITDRYVELPDSLFHITTTALDLLGNVVKTKEAQDALAHCPTLLALLATFVDPKTIFPTAARQAGVSEEEESAEARGFVLPMSHVLASLRILKACAYYDDVRAQLIRMGVLPALLAVALFVPLAAPAAHAAPASPKHQELEEVVLTCMEITRLLIADSAVRFLLSAWLTPPLLKILLESPVDFAKAARTDTHTPVLIWTAEMREQLRPALDAELELVRKLPPSQRQFDAPAAAEKFGTYRALQDESYIESIYVVAYNTDPQFPLPAPQAFAAALLSEIQRAAEATGLGAAHELSLFATALRHCLKSHAGLLPLLPANAAFLRLLALPALRFCDRPAPSASSPPASPHGAPPTPAPAPAMDTTEPPAPAAVEAMWEALLALLTLYLELPQHAELVAPAGMALYQSVVLPALAGQLPARSEPTLVPRWPEARVPAPPLHAVLQFLAALARVLPHVAERARATGLLTCALCTLLAVDSTPARAAAARLLGAAVQQGPWTLQFLSDPFKPLLADAYARPESFLQFFDKRHVKPDIFWTNAIRAELRACLESDLEPLAAALPAALRSLTEQLCLAPELADRTYGPCALEFDWQEAAERVYMPTLHNEVCVAGVYVRIYIESPNFRLADPPAFASEIIDATQHELAFFKSLSGSAPGEGSSLLRSLAAWVFRRQEKQAQKHKGPKRPGSAANRPDEPVPNRERLALQNLHLLLRTLATHLHNNPTLAQAPKVQDAINLLFDIIALAEPSRELSIHVASAALNVIHVLSIEQACALVIRDRRHMAALCNSLYRFVDAPVRATIITTVTELIRRSSGVVAQLCPSGFIVTALFLLLTLPTGDTRSALASLVSMACGDAAHGSDILQYLLRFQIPNFADESMRPAGVLECVTSDEGEWGETLRAKLIQGLKPQIEAVIREDAARWDGSAHRWDPALLDSIIPPPAPETSEPEASTDAPAE